MKNNMIYLFCTVFFIITILCKLFLNTPLNIVLPIIMVLWSILIMISEHYTNRSKIILTSILILISVSILVRDL